MARILGRASLKASLFFSKCPLILFFFDSAVLEIFCRSSANKFPDCFTIFSNSSFWVSSLFCSSMHRAAKVFSSWLRSSIYWTIVLIALWIGSLVSSSCESFNCTFGSSPGNTRSCIYLMNFLVGLLISEVSSVSVQAVTAAVKLGSTSFSR